MESTIGHIYLYVSDLSESMEFYKTILEALDYDHSYTADWGCSFTKGRTDIWLEQAPEDAKNEYHRRNPGLNHLAFWVNTKEDVDKFYEEILKKDEVKTLYETPKAYPEYGDGYYAVFFEDPDGIKLEVAFYKG